MPHYTPALSGNSTRSFCLLLPEECPILSRLQEADLGKKTLLKLATFTLKIVGVTAAVMHWDTILRKKEAIIGMAH